MIESILVLNNGKVANITSARLQDVDKKKLVWVDVQDPSIEDVEFLEKNFASINCRNSKTRTGAEVIIKWNNKDLFNI